MNDGIARARSNLAAVGGECDRENMIYVCFDWFSDQCTCRSIPESETAISMAGDDAAAIWVYCDSTNPRARRDRA